MHSGNKAPGDADDEIALVATDGGLALKGASSPDPGAEADGAGAGETAADEAVTQLSRDAADTAADHAAEADAEASAATIQRPRRLSVLLLVAALALVIDLISKLLVVANLSHRSPIDLGVINFTLVRNSGAAFSIGEGQTWVFTVIAAAVVFVILRVSRNLRSLPWACALGLLLGGALGNLGDRIFRSPGLFRGHVVDFIQFHTFPVVHYDFPVFNLADSAIVIGGCLMVLLSFLGVQPDGTRHRG